MVGVATILLSFWLVGVSAPRAVSDTIHVLLFIAVCLVFWKAWDYRTHHQG